MIDPMGFIGLGALFAPAFAHGLEQQDVSVIFPILGAGGAPLEP